MQQFFEAFPKVTEFTQNPVEIAGEGDLAFHGALTRWQCSQRTQQSR